MREVQEKRKIKDQDKREFIKQIEDTAIMATQMQNITSQILSESQKPDHEK
jgi:flagellum-specific peptidoglycan hydrolase FlgJ